MTWRNTVINTNLKGKVALITGANHGIGAPTALALVPRQINYVDVLG